MRCVRLGGSVHPNGAVSFVSDMTGHAIEEVKNASVRLRQRAFVTAPDAARQERDALDAAERQAGRIPSDFSPRAGAEKGRPLSAALRPAKHCAFLSELM